MNIFEQASRQQLRFSTSKGDVTTEQLWDMPLTSKSGFDLDTAAQAVALTLETSTTKSFVNPKPNLGAVENTLRLDILKHIIAAKIQEKADTLAAAERSQKKARILEALAAQEDKELGSKTKEELLKELEALGA